MTDANHDNHTPLARLSDADAAILDALLEARARDVHPAPLPPGADPQRVARVESLLGLLAMDAPADDATEAELDTLTARTIDALAELRQRERFASQVAVFAEPRRTLGVSWRQVVTSAAVFLIGFSLLLPVLNKSRADAMRTACAANLGSLGSSFSLYANDHQGQLPRYDVNPASPWWHVGQANEPSGGEPSGGAPGQPVQSNSANLYLLVRSGYTNPDDIHCVANEHAPRGRLTAQSFDFPSHEAVSYSYQNQFRPQAIRINVQGQTLTLLADRNPLFVITPSQFSQRADLATTAPSVVHGSRGQNVLIANGQVIWTVRPVVESPAGKAPDNLWTVMGVTRYTGQETPADQSDNFLVP